jgi:adenylate cyclase
MEIKFISNYINQINTVLWIAFFWTLISALLLGFEYIILIENGSAPGWFLDGNYWNYFLIFTTTFTIIGLLGGAFIVFFLLRWFRTMPYGVAILYSVLSFSILFFLFTTFQMYFLAMSHVGLDRINHEVWISLGIYFSSLEFIRYYIFWMLVLIGTIISLFVSDKYGPGILKNFLLGKYFHPKVEERIFMFLDLKGSTAIAEKLGEHKYFGFLKKVIIDVTPSILNAQGEIYQYVGDEIVISWSLKRGLRNANCVKCFFEIQEVLKSKHAFYENQFATQPVFKAGLHCGRVIAGEIGVIKRDITFSGDVLNTTARIQSKCNDFKVFVLVSGYLNSLLSTNSMNYKPKRMGDVPLRGKEKPIELYTLV